MSARFAEVPVVSRVLVNVTIFVTERPGSNAAEMVAADGVPPTVSTGDESVNEALICFRFVTLTESIFLIM